MAHGLILDYALLRETWWLLMGVLLIGFAVMDGFDLGTAGLLPFIAKTDEDRRVVINTIGPVWEGNQVWFILGGGAVFAAWPYVYAVSFSGFYLAMFVLLLTFILRPVAIKFRSKFNAARHRFIWDWVLCIAGILAMTLFGVAVGNAMEGVPFSFNDDMRMTYTGGLIDLVNPFALLCGLVSLTMLLTHGANYLSLRTTVPIADRACGAARILSLVALVLFVLGGFYAARLPFFMPTVAYFTHAAQISPSNPMHKTVVTVVGGLLNNYHQYAWMMIAPAMGCLGLLGTCALQFARRPGLAIVSSGLALFGIIATAGVSMYPFILPSSTYPSQSLTVYDASSSQLTLMIMLAAAVVFMPVVLAYTAWVYKVLSGKITSASVGANDQSY